VLFASVPKVKIEITLRRFSDLGHDSNILDDRRTENTTLVIPTKIRRDP